MVGLKTLVLNKNYIPISIFPLAVIPAEDAFTRVVNRTCSVVIDYNIAIKSQHHSYHWPSIIVRNDNITIKEMVKLKRESLYYRDHGRCMYCNKPITINESTADHVYPASLGGKFTWENIVTACSACNTMKGNHLPKGDWAPIKRPYKPTYWELLDARRQFPLVVGDIRWMNFIGQWKAPVAVR